MHFLRNKLALAALFLTLGLGAMQQELNTQQANEFLLYSVKNGGHENLKLAIQLGGKPSEIVDQNGDHVITIAMMNAPDLLASLLIEDLLKHGAPRTGALNLAVQKGLVRTVNVLLEAGEKVDQRDELLKLTPVQLACFLGDYDMAKTLLLHNADRKPTGPSLWALAKKSNPSIIEYLLDRSNKQIEEADKKCEDY